MAKDDGKTLVRETVAQVSKPGRKPLLTDELAKAIIGMIRGGTGKGAACDSLGIDIRTLQIWKKKGRAGEERYAAFTAELDMVEAQLRGFGAQTIFKAGKDEVSRPICPQCKRRYSSLECRSCGEKVDLRCEEPDCLGRRLQVHLHGDWRAMDKWMSKQFPMEWGERINIDMQGQLRAFVLAIRDEFEDDENGDEIFQRILAIAKRGAGEGVDPGRRR